MKYLLDTHYLIWSIVDTKRLPKKVKDVIIDPVNEIFISTVTFWEISLKVSLGKLTLKGFTPADLPAICSKLNFQIENLSAMESSTLHLLKANHHKDPFDRMLVWQAIGKGYMLITEDDSIRKYVSEGLRIFE